MDQKEINLQDLGRKLVDEHVYRSQMFVLEMAQKLYCDRIPDWAPFDEADLDDLFGSLRYYNVVLTDPESGDTYEEEVGYGDIDQCIEDLEDAIGDQENEEIDSTEDSAKLVRLRDNLDTLTRARDRGEYDSREPYECYLVSDWLGRRLQKEGEAVLDTHGGTWWFRCCTGQAICLDGVIQQIANEEYGDK